MRRPDHAPVRRPHRRPHRRSQLRLAAASTLIAALALTACGGSDGDKKHSTSPTGTTPTSSGAPTSSAAKLNGYPLIVHGVTTKQNTALIKVVPLLPGVQNTSYDGSSKTLRVFMKKTATVDERAVVISQLQKYTKKKATPETTAPPLTPASPSTSR